MSWSRLSLLAAFTLLVSSCTERSTTGQQDGAVVRDVTIVDARPVDVATTPDASPDLPPPDQPPGICGNGIVEPGETCDIAIAKGQPGACPTPASCDAGVVCVVYGVRYDGTCQATCRESPVVGCHDGDGCCAAGCTSTTDSDCAGPHCGDGLWEPPLETCDTAIISGPGACPKDCDDQQPCTTDLWTKAGTCLARCTHTPIVTCASGDGCCPVGCTAVNDGDC